MLEWIRQLDDLLKQQVPVVLITVAAVKGSTPREAGAKMLVSEQGVFCTIGGGHLEFKAIQIARNMLLQDSATALQRFSLGAGLGQCCGGVVTLLFECIRQREPWLDDLIRYQRSQQPCIQVVPLQQQALDSRFIVGSKEPAEDSTVYSKAQQMLEESSECGIKSFDCDNGLTKQFVFDPILVQDFNVYVFGAGHVGQALVEHLAHHELHITWVDTRDGQLPETLANNVVSYCTDTPEAVIDEAAAGSYFVLMTHDHQLDQHLTELILKRDDYDYFGLIGSHTKRKKFEHRLSRKGIPAHALKRMSCPIGIVGINSKKPSAIGLSVCAEILQVHEARRLQQAGIDKQSMSV